jgi:hypothetical protein
MVTFLLDRTGSMSSCKAATIESFNAYLDGLRGQKGLTFTFVQFDSQSIDKVAVDADPAKVADLTNETYQPRASTPLIDAAYQTIEAVAAKLAGKPKGTKVVVCIQTDGEENCSREHTWADLNKLIREKTALGWQFNFMGAGIDAYQQGAAMGISVANTVSYDHMDLAATKAVFAASASNTAAFSAGRSVGTAYSALQKRAAGDKFDPANLMQINPQPKRTPVGKLNLSK